MQKTDAVPVLFHKILGHVVQEMHTMSSHETAASSTPTASAVADV